MLRKFYPYYLANKAIYANQDLKSQREAQGTSIDELVSRELSNKMGRLLE